MCFFMSGVCKSNARLDGKTAVVTGCNTGIGKSTVYELVLRGCRVVMACRNIEKAEEAKQEIEDKFTTRDNRGSIVIVKLDLSSFESINKCAEQILMLEHNIHLLINNAGVFMPPTEKRTEEGFDMQFGTNHLGHFLLTLKLLPRILQSTPARIINVASNFHRFGKIDFTNLDGKENVNPFLGYCNSKLANMLFTRELAKRLEGRNVSVYSVHPGVVYTDIDRHTDKTLVPGITYLHRYIFSWFLKSPEQGSQTTLHCAIDEQAGRETGLYYTDCEVTQPCRHAEDDTTAQRLWEESVKLVKLGDYDPFTNLQNK